MTSFWKVTIFCISIHALREEGDDAIAKQQQEGQKFLSTPSARRATADNDLSKQLGKISIHALREEGDRSEDRNSTATSDFYPRPPRGGRP